MFQDKSSSRSFLYYAGLTLVAKVMGKKILMLGSGVGPLSKKLSQYLWRRLETYFEDVQVRDKASARYFTRPTQITSDLAFYQATYQDQYDPQGPLGVSIRQDAELTLGEWRKSLPDQVIHILCQEGIDETGPHAVTLLDIDPLLHFRGVIAMRYHACVFAALSGVPFMALGIDEKLISLAIQLDQPYVDLRQTVSEESLLESTLDFFQNQENYRQSLITKRILLEGRPHVVI